MQLRFHMWARGLKREQEKDTQGQPHYFEEFCFKKVDGCQTRDVVVSRTLFGLPTRFLFLKVGYEGVCIEMIQEREREFRREKDTCDNKVDEYIGDNQRGWPYVEAGTCLQVQQKRRKSMCLPGHPCVKFD